MCDSPGLPWGVGYSVLFAGLPPGEKKRVAGIKAKLMDLDWDGIAELLKKEIFT